MKQVDPSTIDRFGTGQAGVHRKIGQAYQDWRNANPDKTLGWQPTCACDSPDVVPCTVLDCFSGSGTTGVVCARYGRRYIGIDISQEYLDMSIKRIEYELAHPGQRPRRPKPVEAQATLLEVT